MSVFSIVATFLGPPAFSQVPTPVPNPTAAPERAPAQNPLLSEDDLEVMVARIALYPDELVAAISAASLNPLQLVEADRFLQAKQKNKELKPKDDWDGSVISLLNYPDIVKMMSDDLTWTQALANALTYQQKDVLVAIQQLRDEAMSKNLIKTDDKITVVVENENVIIRPTDPEKIYIPQYQPQMLYEPGYVAQPVSYSSAYYDNYYYPGAAFFAGAVTGIAFAAIVNWDDWGVWGGRWRGDIDIDCNNCFNDRDFNGKLKWNDVDWTKVDRSKLSIGKDQFTNLDRTAIRSGLVSDNRNALRNQAQDRKPGGELSSRQNISRPDDVRRTTADGLKQSSRPSAGKAGENRPAAGRGNQPAKRPSAETRRPAQSAPAVKRKPSAPKMAARPDNRAKQPNALGNVQSGRREAVASKRGGHSMGGGQRGAPRAMASGGGRPFHHGGGRGGRR
ncbi:hypothetical protein BTE56_23020 [Agrobacterium pusense]|nr:hypothetical protein BTE56_23020 [Agrobacterium pusense]